MRRNVGRTATLVAAGVTLAASVARADGQFTLGPTAGVLFLDSHLADYRWETDPRPVWGVSALASTGRWAGGARVSRASTRQATGVPGDDRTLDVSWTGVDAIGEARVATFVGARLLTTASLGMARFAWSPSELSIRGCAGRLAGRGGFQADPGAGRRRRARASSIPRLGTRSVRGCRARLVLAGNVAPPGRPDRHGTGDLRQLDGPRRNHPTARRALRRET